MCARQRATLRHVRVGVRACAAAHSPPRRRGSQATGGPAAVGCDPRTTRPEMTRSTGRTPPPGSWCPPRGTWSPGATKSRVIQPWSRMAKPWQTLTRPSPSHRKIRILKPGESCEDNRGRPSRLTWASSNANPFRPDQTRVHPDICIYRDIYIHIHDMYVYVQDLNT